MPQSAVTSSMRHRTASGLRLLLAFLAPTTLLIPPAAAEAVLDGSTGSSGTFSGDFEIPAAVGRLEGANLFHSFERFRVRNGESATFTGPGGIDNVISRVTGGDVSRINGPLNSTVSGADFFFLNPAGVLFGPGASLSVDGSFHVGAADELRFADGSVFGALGGGSGTFTAASPASFGFLGGGTGGITVDRGRLEVGAGETLSLSGRSLTVSAGGAGLATGGSAGALVAPGGRVILTAVTGEGDVALDGSTVDTTGAGEVLLTGQAAVLAEGAGSGSIRISAGSVEIVDQSNVIAGNTSAGGPDQSTVVEADTLRLGGQSFLITRSTADGPASDVVVRADDVEVSGGSVLGSVALAAGTAGSVDVEAARVTVIEGGRINSDTVAAGAAGEVRVAADAIEVASNGQIRSDTFAAGNAGPVVIEAGRLRIRHGGDDAIQTGILSDAEVGSSGDAGRVTVRADEIDIRAGGQIRAIARSTGDAGGVDIETGDLFLSSEGRTALLTAVSSSAAPGSSGDAGTVRVVATDRIAIRDGAQIRTLTFGVGDAGAIEIEADKLLIRADGQSALPTGVLNSAEAGSTGNAGTLTIRADEIDVRGGQIRALTLSSGDAGEIDIETGDLTIDSGGFTAFTTGVLSSTEPDSSGDAGRIRIAAEGTVEVTDGSQINSSSTGSGRPGDLFLNVDQLVVGPGGLVGSVATGPILDPDDVEGGDVRVVAADRIELSGLPGRSAAIAAETFSLRNGGTLFVRAPVLRIVRDARVSSSTIGFGAAGPVTVRVGRLFTGPSGIIASSSPNLQAPQLTGSGGPVKVIADERIVLTGDADRNMPGGVTTTTATAGAAGPITVAAPLLRLENAGQISSGATASGAGGSITIDADRIELDDRALIATSSLSGGADAGVAGGIEIEADRALQLRGRSRISAETASAEAGDIVIRVGDLVELRSSSVTTSVADGRGSGGNIAIDPEFVVLDDSAIVANAREGAGGNITIVADTFLRSPGSIVDASSELGIDGTVDITAPDLDLTSELAVLSTAFVDASRLLRESCAARVGDERSSFVSSGGRSLTPDPGALLPGRYADREATPATFHHWSLHGAGACDG